MKKDTLKKLFFLFGFIFIFLASFLVIQYNSIKFYFDTTIIEVGSDGYVVKAKAFNRDISSAINIKNPIDYNRVGTYEVEVSYKTFMSFVKKDSRTVTIVDDIAPTLELLGSQTIYLNLGSDYKEYGYTVYDNYDKSINVNINGSVDTNKIGTYILEYVARDSSNNITVKTREIIVK